MSVKTTIPCAKMPEVDDAVTPAEAREAKVATARETVRNFLDKQRASDSPNELAIRACELSLVSGCSARLISCARQCDTENDSPEKLVQAAVDRLEASDASALGGTAKSVIGILQAGLSSPRALHAAAGLATTVQIGLDAEEYQEEDGDAEGPDQYINGDQNEAVAEWEPELQRMHEDFKAQGVSYVLVVQKSLTDGRSEMLTSVNRFGARTSPLIHDLGEYLSDARKSQD